MTDFDPTKPVTTRDGREAVIDKVLTADEALRNTKMILGQRKDQDGEWMIASWLADGRYFPGGRSNHDLVNIVPAEPERFVNLYGPVGRSSFDILIHSSLALAKINASKDNYLGTFRLVRVDEEAGGTGGTKK